MPKLSVIVPVWNGEKYIKRCIDSILNQSLKDLEIIIVDDKSTDSTLELLKHHYFDTINISIVCHDTNEGTGAARNTGLRHACGKYIAFLDADDWIDTNAYMKMTSILETVHTDIAVCGIMTEFSSPVLSELRYSYAYHNTISAEFALKLLSKNEAQDSYISPMVGNKVFRHSFLKRHSLTFPNKNNFEDDEFMFKSFLYAKSVSLVPNTFHHYFQRQGSAMHSFSKLTIDDFISTFLSIKKELDAVQEWEIKSSEYYSFFDKCLSSLLNTLFSSEQQVESQRNYLSYLLEEIINRFSLKELVAHIDPIRLSRLWN